MSGRDIGHLGELALDTWCTQVGIVANKVQRDLAGWDYFLEFPIITEGHKINLLDKEPFPLRCLIQVKSTDDRLGRWQVKLDNWLRLVKNPLPCFFLILEFDNKNEYQRAFLVHVDKIYITNVLKRLRKVKPKDVHNLHKKTLVLTYKKVNLVNPLNGTGLSHAIKEAVSVSPEVYAQQKNDIIKTVGYEGGGWNFNVTLFPPLQQDFDPKEALVDFLIGLTPYLETARLEIIDARFGIILPEGRKVIEEAGRLEVERVSIGKGTIKLRLEDSQAELRIDTDVYVPQGLQIVLPNKYFKVRFAAPFINFITRPGYDSSCHITYNLPELSEKHSLRDLQSVSKLIGLLQESVVTQKAIDCEMLFNSRPYTRGQVHVEESPKGDLAEIADTIRKAWLIVQYFDLAQDITISPMILLEQQGPINFIAAVIGRERGWFRITFTLDNETPDTSDLYCVPMGGSLDLGDFKVVIAVGILGNIESHYVIEENTLQYRLTTDQIVLCKQYIFDSEEPVKLTDEDLKEIVVAQLQEKAKIIRLDYIF